MCVAAQAARRRKRVTSNVERPLSPVVTDCFWPNSAVEERLERELLAGDRCWRSGQVEMNPVFRCIRNMYPGGLEPVYDLPGVAQRSLLDGVPGAVRSG